MYVIIVHFNIRKYVGVYFQNEHRKPIRLIILDLGEKKLIFFFKITFIMLRMQSLTHIPQMV